MNLGEGDVWDFFVLFLHFSVSLKLFLSKSFLKGSYNFRLLDKGSGDWNCSL